VELVASKLSRTALIDCDEADAMPVLDGERPKPHLQQVSSDNRNPI